MAYTAEYSTSALQEILVDFVSTVALKIKDFSDILALLLVLIILALLIRKLTSPFSHEPKQTKRYYK